MKTTFIIISICAVMFATGYKVATTTRATYDYLRIEAGAKGVIISCEGVGGIEPKKVINQQGQKVKDLMVAVEIYQARGYDIINVYGNNYGHFAVMRKKVE